MEISSKENITNFLFKQVNIMYLILQGIRLTENDKRLAFSPKNPSVALHNLKTFLKYSLSKNYKNSKSNIEKYLYYSYI